MSIRSKVFLTVLLCSIAATIVASLASYYSDKVAIGGQVFSKYLLASRIGSALIDPDLVTSVRLSGDEKRPEFGRLQALLRGALHGESSHADSLSIDGQTVKIDSKLKDLNTIVESPDHPGRLTFGVDAEQRYEFAQAPGQAYPATVDLQGLDRAGPWTGLVSGPNMYPDATEIISAKAPIKDHAGKLVAILEIDAPYSVYEGTQRAAAMTAVKSFSIGAVVASGAALLASIWIGRRFAALVTLVEGYLPQPILKAASEGRAFVPASERRLVTVLFLDIRGSTGAAETMRPEAFVRMLNEFFEQMVAPIEQNSGFVNRFLGDGFLAIFGAPQTDAYQHEHAVQAALEMEAAARRLSEKWQAATGNDLNVGIGIHSGSAVVGNVGSSQRFEYTAIGDVVNVASRLQSACKDHKVSILLSGNTYQEARPSFIFEQMGSLEIRGRTEPVIAYSVRSLDA